jgi:hypothetical protein
MSTKKGIGLTFIVTDPLWESLEYSTTLHHYDSYSHTIAAIGGYWTASLTISTTIPQAEDWFANGLGRHIEVRGPSLQVIWEGFVNKISLAMGTLTAERGPYINIANRVKIVYSTIDTSTDPPIMGVRISTAYTDDTISQGKYGICTRILSTGGATAATATQIRDTFLAENKDPETTQSLNIGQSGGGGATVTLELFGYAQLMEHYPYNTTTTGTRTFTLRLEDVLAAEPNALYSTDYSGIASNTSTVPYYDNDDRSGWQVIKDILAKGDSGYDRYTFGIYAGRKAFYTEIPSTVEYLHRIRDNKQRIDRIIGGNEVMPWDVLPARWVLVSDFLVGRNVSGSELRDDPRNLFIESVTYTAPWGLQITGAKVATMPQLLARLGLSGIGA